MYGLRQVRRNRSVSLICVSVLAIGIGSAAAVFTVLYDAILKPLPYPKSEQLVYLHNEFPQSPAAQKGVSGPDFADLTARRELFSATAAYFFNDFTVTGSGSGYAQHVDAVNVSAALFALLKIRPELGRTFTNGEDFSGSKVAVLSDRFWRETFGGDRDVIKRSMVLDGVSYRIVGVMPAGFAFPYPATQMWVPLSLSPAALAPAARRRKWLQMIARLSPGLTPTLANSMLAQASHSYATEFPEVYPENAGWHFSCVPMITQQTRAIRGWLILAFGSVLCVLLIACINASGLLLVRATVRQREWSVRAALGATRARLFRQILTETALLVVAAGTCGIALAIGAVQLINKSGPIGRATIGSWTFAFVLASIAGSVLLAGILPAAGVARLPLNLSLREGGGRIAIGRRGWRNATVAAQIAIAIALLFTATALVRSFVKLLDVPLGFSPERIWTASIQLPERGHNTAAAAAQFFEDLTDRVSGLPGVEAASGGTIPFSPDGQQGLDLYFPNRPESTVPPAAALNLVLPHYFSTLGIPLLEGRDVTISDRMGTRLVAIVDSAFVQKYFPGENAIGKVVARDGARDKAYTIVGVVGSVRGTDPSDTPEPEVYLPELQDGQPALFLFVRQAPGQDVTKAIREELRDLAPNVALFEVNALSDRVSGAVRLRRFVAWLLSGFAAIGLFLAALGLYGSLAYLVELRRREVGIRIALGARAKDIGRLFARHCFWIAFMGLIPGLVLAFAFSRVLKTFFFEIGPFDLWTVFITIAGLFLLTIIASWIPILSAVRIDPSHALRIE